jgi:hypothetical protein
MNFDPELFTFAAEFLESHGGIAELHEERLLVLLPSPLAQMLSMPEEAHFGQDGEPLLYGSPVLDRLISAATSEIPMVFGHIEVPYLKKGGFDEVIARDLVFDNSKVSVINRAETRTSYMLMICRYTALSDERKEGLIEVGVHEQRGAIIDNFENKWMEFDSEFYPKDGVPPHFPIDIEKTVDMAMQRTIKVAEQRLATFFSSMERRLQRDVKNTREYYTALKREMKSGLSRTTLNEAQKQERMAKIQDLPQEMARKIDDLEHKYKIQVRLNGCAVIRFLVDVVQIMVEILHRKFKRSITLIWNPISRQMDPLVCEHCHATTRTIHPHMKATALRLICPECVQKITQESMVKR